MGEMVEALIYFFKKSSNVAGLRPSRKKNRYIYRRYVDCILRGQKRCYVDYEKKHSFIFQKVLQVRRSSPKSQKNRYIYRRYVDCILRGGRWSLCRL